MKYAACLLVAFACSGAFASEPGQPFDCADVVFLEPGLACVEVAGLYAMIAGNRRGD